jgi:hypothetical protein
MSTFLTIILIVLCLGVALLAFLRWQKKKNLWLMLALITAVLAAAAFALSPVIGGFLGVLALLLLLLGLWSKRGS